MTSKGAAKVRAEQSAEPAPAPSRARIVEDQSEVIAFLSDPASYGDGRAKVSRIDTHGAAVFLVGARAYKLKHAVKLPYMDFSTIARRRAACEAELRLNRRTAPEIYRRLCPVTRAADGELALGGAGRAVDWLVEMVRFDQKLLFDRMAERGELDGALMEQLADVVAAFHAEAERQSGGGGAEALERVIDNNARAFESFTGRVLDAAQARRLTGAARGSLEAHRELIERRRRAGFVRRGHGDLHLRNICLFEGRPTLFDALEFDERLATHDVLYDLAFLLMDLWHRDHRDFANLVLNRYLWHQPELAGLALLPLFLSCRAGIRAHVSASMAEWQDDAAKVESLHDEARAYLALGLEFLTPQAPLLLAIGGLSGSGKTTLARSVAPGLGRPPGAAVLRSDVVRKQIMGVAPTQRLGPEGYERSVTTRTYATLRARAGDALRAGQSVVVDAVHARPDERAALRQVAEDAGQAFLGLWLEAPPAAMAERLKARRGDASDATLAVLEQQLAYDLGEVAWRRIDTGSGIEATAERVTRLLAAGLQRDCSGRGSVPS